MKRYLLIMMILLSGSAAVPAADLTMSDLFVRRGFQEQWIKALPAPDAEEWKTVPANRGNRPVRVRDLHLSGIPAFHHFTLHRTAPQTFTYVTSFVHTRADDDAETSGLYLAQIGMNWEIFLNGHSLKKEEHLNPDGTMQRERAVRGLLIPLQQKHLREGVNILAFKITGDPTDDRTGLYMTHPYLTGPYEELLPLKNERIDLMLIAVYFFFGILYLSIYFMRRKETYTFFYGTASILIAVFFFCRTFVIFDIIGSTRTISYIQFSSMFLTIPMLTLFTDSLLRGKLSLFSKVYFSVCCILIAGIFFPFAETVHRIWQMLAPVSLLYILVFNIFKHLIKDGTSIYKKSSGAMLIRLTESIASAVIKTTAGNLLIGFIAVLLCIVIDIIQANRGIPSLLSRYGFFFLMMGLSGILIKRYIDVYQRLDAGKEMLEKRVAERTDELSRSLENLKETQQKLVQTEKLASQGKMIAGVAHEINTPLGNSLTAASFLAEKTAAFKELFVKNSLNTNDMEQYISNASESTQILSVNLDKAASLISTFRQIDMDAGKERCIETNLKNFIDEVLFNLSDKFKDNHHNVFVDCPDDCTTKIYPDTMFQIFSQLITNAIIHGFHGINNGTISISVHIEKNTLIIIFGDNGRGMDAEALNHIFDPFFTTRRNLGCIGLGMHIVYNFITQFLKGEITCVSTVGKGTSFTISIPVQ